MKYKIYKVARKILPKSVIDRVARSSITRPLRDRFFRPDGRDDIETGMVSWGDLEFYFAAPYQKLYQAQTIGVENSISHLARTILLKGGSAIDIGANYGFVTLVMAKSVSSGNHVISLEIQPAIAKILKQTIDLNDLTTLCTVIAKGAGAKDSDQVVTIDTALQKSLAQWISVIKIDVDGSDFEVLLGAERTLRKHYPVVIVEMTKKEQEIYGFLVSLGYTFFTDQHGEAITQGSWPPNLVASTKPVFASRSA